MAQVVTLRRRALQSRDAIELLSNKWRITVLHLLREGTLRTNAIQTAVPEVSPKMLTQTLRGMERDGLLVRRAHQASPVRVEYQLTPMGQSLLNPLQNLCHWAKAHVEERDRARKHFDHERAISPNHHSRTGERRTL